MDVKITMSNRKRKSTFTFSKVKACLAGNRSDQAGLPQERN